MHQILTFRIRDKIISFINLNMNLLFKSDFLISLFNAPHDYKINYNIGIVSKNCSEKNKNKNKTLTR